jgi:hypothetical protein
MTNHDVALLWMADVVNRLHEAWPERTSLTLAQTLEATNASPPANKQEKLWCDLWLWLVEEGLVRIKQEQLEQLAGPRITYFGWRIDMAVLTAKGLDAVCSIAQPATPEISLGNRIIISHSEAG